MRGLTLRRFYTYLSTNIGPRALKKLGYNALEPHGRSRPANEDFGMVVPFSYPVATRLDSQKIAVICHLFHAELAPWLLEILRRSGLFADIYISTDTTRKRDAIRNALSQWMRGKLTIRVVENRGRDIAPKILTFSDIYDQYDLALFLHSKKSSHYDFGEEWRNYLVECLAGSPSISNSVLEIFDHCPEVGIVFPQHFYRLVATTPIDWGSNFKKARRLARRMNIDLSDDSYLDIPSGSMFWVRPRALRPLLDLNLSIDDFPGEYGQLDGTLAHSIERLFLFVCEKAGYTWVKVTTESSVNSECPVVRIGAKSQINAFITQHRFDLLGERYNARR